MKKNTKILTLLLAVLLCLPLATACEMPSDDDTPKYAQVYLSTGTQSHLLSRGTSLELLEYSGAQGNIEIKVDTGLKYQNYYGNGASLTHSSAHLLMQEGADEIRAEILNELFSENGARFNFLRIPIGASDYIQGTEFFTNCDVKDEALNSFTLEHDKDLIAVLKEILTINPDINIVAVPWSAPAWMKTNNNLIGGDLDEAYNEIFADYLVKFVEEYKKQGININYLSILNEPYIWGVKYPSMYMGEKQAVKIIKSLGKKLKDAGLGVKIMAWDHNVDNEENYLRTIYGDLGASKYVSGTAYHGYSGMYTDGCKSHSERYPYKEIYLTEITEHSGSTDFTSNFMYAVNNVTVNPINYGSSASMYWNLVLRSDGSPTPAHDSSACYGVIDMNKTDGGFEYSKSSAFYAMAHVSQFAYNVEGEVPLGLRVENSNKDIASCALYRADGAVVVVLGNTSRKELTIDLVVDGKCLTYTIDAQSVVTFVI